MTESVNSPLFPKIVYWIAVVICGLWAAFILQKWIAIGGFTGGILDDGQSAVRISLLVSAPLAMFAALLMRSGAVVWIYALHFGQNILPWLTIDRIYTSPQEALFSILALHPVLIAVQVAALIFLVYTNQVRRL